MSFDVVASSRVENARMHVRGSTSLHGRRPARGRRLRAGAGRHPRRCSTTGRSSSASLTLGLCHARRCVPGGRGILVGSAAPVSRAAGQTVAGGCGGGAIAGSDRRDAADRHEPRQSADDFRRPRSAAAEMLTFSQPTRAAGIAASLRARRRTGSRRRAAGRAAAADPPAAVGWRQWRAASPGSSRS